MNHDTKRNHITPFNHLLILMITGPPADTNLFNPAGTKPVAPLPQLNHLQLQEFMAGGSLHGRLFGRAQPSLAPQQRRLIACQTAEAHGGRCGSLGERLIGGDQAMLKLWLNYF